MTTTIKITGMAAIKHAEREGLTLSVHNSPIEDARDGLSPTEAREVASADSDLVYIEMSAELVHERLTWAEVNGSLSPDCRRVLGDERQVLGLAIKSGDIDRIARAGREAARVAEMWGVTV